MGYLRPAGSEIASWPVFDLDDYAFSARAHFVAGYDRTVGVAASHRVADGVEVRFATLNLDCAP